MPITQLKQNQSSGFILLFTVIIVTILLITVLGIASVASNQIRFVRDEFESAKALYAADTGIECVRFYQAQFNAFDSHQAPQTINCGVGTLQAGDTAGSDCFDKTYAPVLMNGFSNGACVEVSVAVTSRTINVGGILRRVCDVYVQSSGYNKCPGPGVTNLIERTRWETL